MGLLFWESKIKKDFLVLDIGSEAIKFAFLKKRRDEVELQAWALEYLDEYKSSSLNEEEIIRKIISRTLKRPEFKRFPKDVLLGLSPSILKARIAFVSIQRKNSKVTLKKREANLIQVEALAEAKEKISDSVFESFGILPSALRFIYVKVLEIKIDGYPVSCLEGYKGQDIEFKVLLTFALGQSLQRIENIVQFQRVQIIHLAQGLLNLIGLEDGVFLDMGGDATQIFLKKNDKLEEIGDFEKGGRIFSQEISETLGQREREARELKERYSKRELGEEVRAKMAQILAKPQINWYKNLEDAIKKLNISGLLPQKFYLFGGGAKMPEIKKSLEDEMGNTNSMRDVEVKILSLKDYYHSLSLRKEKLPFSILDNPQYTPAFLIFYARENI